MPRLLGVLVVLLMTACATAKRPVEVPIENPIKTELLSQKVKILEWSVKCEGTPVKPECDDGDALLFSALLCASGENFACDVVKRSQDNEGRVWRSPKRVGNEEVNAFSRDQGLGALLYIAATKDVEWANRWWLYIKKTKRLCPQDSDFRCRLTAAYIAFHNYVAEKVPGMEKLSYAWAMREKNEQPIPPSREPNSPVSALDRLWQGLEPVTPSGFPLHLLGVQLYAKVVLGDWNEVLQQITERMVKREPLNPFFLYLQKGQDNAVGSLLLTLLPKQKPASMHQWAWERTDSEKAWESSMGWDMVFLINVATKEN